MGRLSLFAIIWPLTFLRSSYTRTFICSRLGRIWSLKFITLKPRPTVNQRPFRRGNGNQVSKTLPVAWPGEGISSKSTLFQLPWSYVISGLERVNYYSKTEEIDLNFGFRRIQQSLKFISKESTEQSSLPMDWQSPFSKTWNSVSNLGAHSNQWAFEMIYVLQFKYISFIWICMVLRL